MTGRQAHTLTVFTKQKGARLGDFDTTARKRHHANYELPFWPPLFLSKDVLFLAVNGDV